MLNYLSATALARAEFYAFESVVQVFFTRGSTRCVGDRFVSGNAFDRLIRSGKSDIRGFERKST